MPEVKVNIQEQFNCSLERAFKSPMLCDVLKVHTGFLFMPKALRVFNDEKWGEPGETKEIVFAKSIAASAEMVLHDQVLERKENKYWKIKVWNPGGLLLFFTHFVGEWEVKSESSNAVSIVYTYTLCFNSPLLYLPALMFAHFFWKAYMGNVMRNIKAMAQGNEAFLYP
ncbi:MAG: hypothetical protein K1X82_03090 [Bacteroidia bacterium]|nr:hypothetical protein [Bacteroidia bacterium]